MLKRFVFLLFCAFIVFIAHGATETLQWYVDGDVYTTTTCESGDTVSAPTPPTKTGYNFIGWYEFFNRGTFSTWANVPTTTISQYLPDTNGNNTPQQGDYITVTDASDYIIDNMDGYFTFQRYWPSGSDGKSPTIRIFYNGVQSEILASPNSVFGPNDTLKTSGSTGSERAIYANKYIQVNNVDYYPGQQIVVMNIWYSYSGVALHRVQFSTSDTGNHTGTWIFRYYGDWETDGVFGWKPESQIQNNQ